MPSRASRSSDSASAYIRRAIPYHATVITILWVTVLFLSFGFAMLLLVQSARNVAMQRTLDSVVRQQLAAQKDLRVLQRDVDVLQQACARIFPQALAQPNASSTVTATSPSGVLVRGSFSSDGSKYAGYDTSTVGKKGIGVEIVATTRVKHIEIFNPRTESTGAGTLGTSMSVRWKDANTIEYDVLVKKADGTQTKETRTTKIYF